jgi:hypothetical protein
MSIEQQPDQEFPVAPKSRPRASLACIPCRSRHLKCDAKAICSRCELDNRPCIYTKSRRGGKRRQTTLEVPEASPDISISHPSSAAMRTPSSHRNTGSSGHISNRSISGMTPEIQWGTNSQSSGLPETEKLLDLYYDNFHDAHPIAPPRWNLDMRRQSDQGSVQHLVNVLEYIGSIYDANGESEHLRQVAHSSFAYGIPPSNGFSVQALLLFATALHCSDAYEEADSVLNNAIDIALNIQMHSQEFAEANGGKDPVLEESWRRTFWMMFLLDGLFAAITHRPTHRLQNLVVDVDLPCEDSEYESGVSSKVLLTTISDCLIREYLPLAHSPSTIIESLSWKTLYFPHSPISSM